MARSLRILPAVRQDIRDALTFTRTRFGDAKAREYAVLIRLALRALEEEPRSGKRHTEIHADAWTLHIKQRGHKARHLFLYEIVDGTARIYGLLYDGMDLPAQWAERAKQLPEDDE